MCVGICSCCSCGIHRVRLPVPTGESSGSGSIWLKSMVLHATRSSAGSSSLKRFILKTKADKNSLTHKVQTADCKRVSGKLTFFNLRKRRPLMS